jgi:hypothetical protein
MTGSADKTRPEQPAPQDQSHSGRSIPRPAGLSPVVWLFRTELKRQIALAGHVLVKEYIDDGYTGTVMEPALEVAARGHSAKARRCRFRRCEFAPHARAS